MAVKKEKTEYEKLVKDMKSTRCSVDEIIKRISGIYEKWDKVEGAADVDNFCSNCDEIKTVREPEEFWGSTCYRQFQDCPAEFNPESSDCPYSDEYAARLEEREEARETLDKLYALEETLLAKQSKDKKEVHTNG